jgi:phosphoglucosamine mutase
MARERQTLADLAARIPLLPQQQRAVTARQRDLWESDRAFTSAVADAQGRLGPHGRILVRPSGTEPALRIMVEGPDAKVVTEVADALAVIAKERLD